MKEIELGEWDAIHVVTCHLTPEKATYTVISTLMISLETKTEAVGKMTIAGAGSKTAKTEVACDAAFNRDTDAAHIRTLGKMIENNEDLLRAEVGDIYCSKQRQITNSGRLLEEYMTKDEKKSFQEELAAAQ